MDLTPSSPAASARRIGPLYTIGLVVVLIADAVLAFGLALLHAGKYASQSAAESIGYTVAYGGCSLLCPLVTLVAAAALLARMINKPFGSTLIKTLFWSGLTLVPLFLLLLTASALLPKH
jgi:hypothetical protein